MTQTDKARWDARRRLEDAIEAYADARVSWVNGDLVTKTWDEVEAAIDEVEMVNQTEEE